MKKIQNIKTLSKKLQQLKKKGKKIVLCHGVFDILHIGHIKHFQSAKKMGNILVVSVTPDKFVNKGPNRPIFPINLRMQSLASLKSVDYVVPNISDTAVYPILNLKPNIYCKGKDYSNSKLDISGNINKEISAIKKVKGKINFTEDELFSSSKIINSTNINLSKKQGDFLNSLKKDKGIKKFDPSKLINSFKSLKVLVIGETIIDEYIYCDALGKSGKEPVLAVKYLKSKKMIGGTMSIAKNLSSFCKKITVLSYVGEKNEQLNFIKKNLQKNINPIFLKKKNSCTIIKKRYVDDVSKSKILGVYSIEDQLISKKEEKILSKHILNQIKNHDLVIVSDYGHGFLNEKLSKLIIKNSKYVAVNAQLNASNIGFHTISKYKNADLVIINENEMRHEMRDKSSELNYLIKKLAKKINSKLITVTSGDQGSTSYNKKINKVFNCPAFASKVVDKIGAGDTMLAVLSLAIHKKANIKFSMFLSALAAAINVQSEANSLVLNRVDMIKSIQSYLK